MRFDVSVHFVAANNTYQAQVIVRRRQPSGDPVECVTLTFSNRHETAAAAISEAEAHAESIRARPEDYRTLLDPVFKRVA
jgi:hypothetical protein